MGEPKLEKANDPFSDMKKIEMDKQKDEEDVDRNKMKSERKNSMPTNPNKPSVRPKIDKETIKKHKPPSSPTATPKKEEDALPTYTVFTNETVEQKKEATKDAMAMKSENVKKEKEKRKAAMT